MREGDADGPIPQFTVDTHRPVRAFDLFGRLVRHRARLHQPAHRARPGRHPAPRRRPRRRRPDRARRRPRRLQPRAGRRLHRRRRPRRRRGGRARDLRRRPRVEGRGPSRWSPDELLRRLAVGGSVYVPALLRRDVRRRRDHRGGGAQPPRHPAPRPQAHPDGPRRLAVPRQAPGAARRDRARALQRRDLPGLHPRLPVLPGRHDHPPGPGALDQHHRRHGRERHPRVRLRGGRPAVAVERRPHRDRRGRDRPRRPLRGLQRLALAALHPGRRLQHHAGQRVLAQRSPLRPDLRPRGRVRADAQGDQQGGHRGGPDPDRRHGVLPRLATGEALLHVRPADRDRTRT